MKVMIIGCGYVGLVTGVCFAEWGNEIIGVDIDENKLARLRAGKPHFYEPGLEEMMADNKERMIFISSVEEGMKMDPEIVFICVGTPSGNNGGHDLFYVFESARQIALHAKNNIVVVGKSTVPVGTGEEIKKALLAYRPELKFYLASNPETLKEGEAIHDFYNPDRIIIGYDDEAAKDKLLELYKPLATAENKTPFVLTDIKSAEMVKEVSNFMLAQRISTAYLISQVCEKNGADAVEVLKGVSLDKRIGQHFLKIGPGFGGSCFPKDVRSFAGRVRSLAMPTGLVDGVLEANEAQKKLFVEKVRVAFHGYLDGKRLALWGLSFKPHTDDIRESASLDIVRQLLSLGAKIAAYDPKAMGNFKKIYPELYYTEDKYLALEGSDALMIITDWPEFKEADFLKMKKIMNIPRIIDGRNMFEPAEVRKYGIEYISIGRR